MITKQHFMLRITENEQPAMRVILRNGHHVIETQLVFDTGADNTLIREDLIRSLGMPSDVGMIGINFGGAMTDGCRCYSIGIEIPDFKYRDDDHVVIGTKTLNGMGDKQGVIGRDIICRMNVLLQGVGE